MSDADITLRETATTDEEGRFDFKAPVDLARLPGARLLIVSADDKERAFHRFPGDGQGVALDELAIRLEPARLVRVRVRGAEGEPVAGAHVGIGLLPPVIISGIKTDETGLATAQVPRSESILSIVALKEGAGAGFRSYAVASIRRARAFPDGQQFPESGEESLALAGAQRLTLRVIDEEGAPVPGVRLHPSRVMMPGAPMFGDLSAVAEHIARRTDQKGLASFGWIPNEPLSRLEFSLYAEGYQATRSTIAPQARPAPVDVQLKRLAPARRNVIKEQEAGRGGVRPGNRLAGFGHERPNSGRSMRLTSMSTPRT
jgi:hypothetical protein